jgi:hypothetical protein
MLLVQEGEFGSTREMGTFQISLQEKCFGFVVLDTLKVVFKEFLKCFFEAT